MNTVTNLKNELRIAIENEAEKLIEENENVKELIEHCRKFENDPYMAKSERTFNENGDYVSQLVIPNLLEDFDDDIQTELIAKITENYCCYILEDRHGITLETFLGEPVTINFSDRHCYAVHSSELRLKINYKELIGDDDSEKQTYALYIIETAMRKAGYFPNIVLIDYYGGFIEELSTDLGNLSDEELKEYGKQFEVNDEE